MPNTIEDKPRKVTRRQPTKGVRGGRPHLEPPKSDSNPQSLPHKDGSKTNKLPVIDYLVTYWVRHYRHCSSKKEIKEQFDGRDGVMIEEVKKVKHNA